jgi:hypothetical protein
MQLNDWLRFWPGPSTSLRSAQDDSFFYRGRVAVANTSLIPRQVDSVRSRSPSPCESACGGSVLLAPTSQDRDDGM